MTIDDIEAENHRLKAELEGLDYILSSYELLETVLSNVGVHIYMKAADGRYLYANRYFLESADLRLEQVLGRTDAELFPESDFERVDAQVFATGQVLQVEEHLVNAKGENEYYLSTKLLLKRPGHPDYLIGMSTPITQLKASQETVRRSDARFRALFESSSEAVMVMSRTRFLDCNDATLRLLGVSSKADFLQLTPADLSPALEPSGTPSALRAEPMIGQAFEKGHLQFELTLRRCDNGLEIPGEAVMTAVELDDGPALLITLRDQTERKRYEEQISRLAFYDPLTQLPNRRLFNERLSQALVQHHRSKNHGCLVYLDLDNFKPLNDQHGHSAGDLLLQEVGRRLAGCVRTQDTVARLGGDEFVVLLIELDTAADIALSQGNHVAEKILAELERPYVLSLESSAELTKTVEHRCTASLGLTLFSPMEKDIDHILRRADDAMYRAKALGRNQIFIAASVHEAG